MPDPDNLLSVRDIEATNVRPAFEASLEHGATEAELAEQIGWRRAELEAEGATVSGESTYRHMELMSGKPGYPQFVLAATRRHTPASLGVVGLACKTATTLGEAMACHHRFQHLTNRTARYTTTIEGPRLVLRERRHGPACPGSVLVSDYTMFIALQLLRATAQRPPTVRVLHSRRDAMPTGERRLYERFVGAEIELGAPHAQLVLDASTLDIPVTTADVELAAYFRGVLERATPPEVGEAPPLAELRIILRDRLVRGTPTGQEVARTLGMGQRTLQRRLAALGLTFADVLESTRRSLAEGYLADPALSISEIAYLLGYAEQASFFRAFRRWHDTTPRRYRRCAL